MKAVFKLIVWMRAPIIEVFPCRQTLWAFPILEQ